MGETDFVAVAIGGYAGFEQRPIGRLHAPRLFEDTRPVGLGTILGLDRRLRSWVAAACAASGRAVATAKTMPARLREPAICQAASSASW